MQDKTDRELLEEIHQMLSENNATLHKIHNRGRWAAIIGSFKWIVYIGLLAGSYYYIQSNLGNLLNVYTGFQDSTNTINEIKEKSTSLDVQSVLDLLGR
jgi:hypothetical protein